MNVTPAFTTVTGVLLMSGDAVQPIYISPHLLSAHTKVTIGMTTIKQMIFTVMDCPFTSGKLKVCASSFSQTWMLLNAEGNGLQLS